MKSNTSYNINAGMMMQVTFSRKIIVLKQLLTIKKLQKRRKRDNSGPPSLQECFPPRNKRAIIVTKNVSTPVGTHACLYTRRPVGGRFRAVDIDMLVFFCFLSFSPIVILLGLTLTRYAFTAIALWCSLKMLNACM